MGILRTAVLALSGYAFFAAFRFIIGLMLPSLTSEFQLSPVESGFFASAPLLASVLITAVAGYISDRIGRKLTFTIGMLVLWLAALISSLSPNYLLALSFIFIAGAGAAFLPPTIYSIMGNLRPRSRGSLVGITASAYNFGGFVGSIGLGLVIALFGWRLGLAALSGLGLICLPVMSLFMGSTSDSQGSKTGVKPSSFSYVGLLKSKNTVFAGASLFMAGYASFTITSWTPTYLIHIGISTALIGVVIGVYSLAGGVAAIVSGRLADAWGEKQLILFTGAIAGVVSIPLYLYRLNFTSVLILMVLIGLLLWPYWNLVTSMVQRLVNPVNVGSITGLVQNIGMVGAFLGPTFTGILINYYGFEPAMTESVLVSLWLYVLLIIPFKEASRDDSTSGSSPGTHSRSLPERKRELRENEAHCKN